MKPFHYHQPSTLEEAISLLEEHGSEARLLAGGTDLLLQMRRGEIEPGHVIDLKGVLGLDSMTYEGKEGLSIGALVTIAQIEHSQVVRDGFPHLHHAACVLGSIQTRNLATIGGNLCNASPAAETAPSLLVSEAELEVAGPQGVRKLPLSEFFKGPGSTSLKRSEILTRIPIPLPPSGAKSLYLNFSPRGHMDIAVVGVAALLVVDGQVCADARIGLGAVAPVPLRAHKAENLLKGKSITLELAAEAARLAASECSPMSDLRASAEYRRRMVEVLTRRAIVELWARGGE